ncbi:MAG TPA: hypothetical protein VHB79_19555 [Polyangiaceae bacterium]|nr:hypothetical protein [Polyangiaceae bacterium]
MGATPGKHEFPAGLREELIKAEKPRIDPKFLQDTVPPNHKPVLTEPEQPVTTPRGGFAAPKPQNAVDRDAPTLIAAPVAKPLEAATPDAVTLVKVPTVKAPQPVVNKVADSPSAPPVDTSRTDPTILIPGVRKKKDNRTLVIGVVAALLLLLAIGLLLRPTGEAEPANAALPPKPPSTTETPIVPHPATPVVAATTTSEVDAAKPAPPAAEAPSPSSAADDASTKKKAGSSSKPQPNTKPAAIAPKPRQGFDPSKPWEED